MSHHYPQGDTLLFQGSVALSSSGSFVSRRISYPFVVDSVLISWVLGTQRTLAIEVLWATENSAPATGRPSGNNVISGLGNARAMVGDARPVTYPIHEVVDQAGAFLKVFATNSDTVEHTVDVMIRIFRLADVEKLDDG
tara:strand:- start:796 stop:1212 length:417 start_codon:yes stop_codon:yes gene_type:complete